MRRDPDQKDEDQFYQRLLLLGAKWFDSYERYSFVNELVADDERAVLALEAGEEPVPTTMERRWIRVGYVAEGGFWVAEYETNLFGMQETDNLLPGDSGRVFIARTMHERCQIIQSMRGARFFASLQEYIGKGCLNAWEEKTRGEFGPLIPTQRVDG